MSKRSIVQFFCMSLVILIVFVGIIIYKRNLDEYKERLSELNRSCTCKLGSIQRIVNGQLEDKLFIPWQASVSRFGLHICMATIINQYFLLTAEHCFTRFKKSSKSSFAVRVGIYELFDPKLKDKTYRVSDIHKFSIFENIDGRQGGDLALVQLFTPIRFEPGLIEPACLDLESKYLQNIQSITNLTESNAKNETKILFVTSGFGTNLPVLYQNDTLISKITPSLVLKTVYLTEVTEEQAPEFAYLSDMFLCVDSLVKEITPCIGDSGNSLNSIANEKSGLTTVQGICSTSIPIQLNDTTVQYCKSYSLYSRLSYEKYRQFVEGAIGELRCLVNNDQLKV